MKETATLGGGCYWCLEALYQRIRGVSKVTSGYSGGHTENPTMQQVYGDDTGHAEVVQVEFDPSEITYREILEIFWVMHDPTTLNRQGHDIGDEYRSVIFYETDAQRETAEDMKNGFAREIWPDPIVTQIEPLEKYWPADEANQDYFNKNPSAAYCQVIINPKLAKLRQQFAKRFKAD
ncbi:MAG TPA: peptide-methionine (S)-S-oxide reductase MsrA [Candidatus Saccharimonadales bacterium]|nr:peptide-methionine (S)-S-oxide reductase MsrA [Candidatus Saccharimonadales bacterium]